MKQDQGMSATDSTLEKTVKPADAKKPAKNLYEPYSTPIVLYNALRSLVLLVFMTAGRIRIRGKHNVPRNGPFIIAANHLSWVDIPLIPAFLPGKVVYMAKEESFHGKVGWLVRFLGAFPVKRGEGDRHALRAADEQLKQGKVMGIFPEGTRSKTHMMAKGHAGLGMIALRSQVPIVPVAIWGSENLLKTFRPSVTIVYGKPMVVKPKGAKITREDIDAATETVMHRIASMLPPEYRGVYAAQGVLQPEAVAEEVQE